MSFINLPENNEEYETIELTIGQPLRYHSANGDISEGKLLSVDECLEILTIRTGDIIQYDEQIHYDDLIEG